MTRSPDRGTKRLSSQKCERPPYPQERTQEVGALKGHNDAGFSVAFSPDRAKASLERLARRPSAALNTQPLDSGRKLES